MKKKSMISALVLSVAMIGLGTGHTYADDYTIDSNILSGVADGNPAALTEQMTITNTQTQNVTQEGDWENGDTVIISAGSLTIRDYNGENGTLTATGGSVTLQNGTLALDGNSSVSNAVILNVQNGSTVSLTGGTLNIGSNDTINGNINTTSGSLIFNDGTSNAPTTAGNNYTIGGSTNVTNNGILAITEAAVNTTGTLTNGAANNVEAAINNAVNATVGTLNNYGSITGTGSFTTNAGTNSGSIVQNAFTVTDDGVFTNTGSIEVTTLTVGEDASIIDGAVERTGSIVTVGGTNAGTIRQNSFTANGEFENTGNIDVNTFNVGIDGEITGDTGTVITVNGINNGSITQNTFTVDTAGGNDAGYNNQGAIDVTTLNVNYGGILDNNGVLVQPQNPEDDPVMQNATVNATTVNNGGTINLTNADIEAEAINNSVVVNIDNVDVTVAGTINLNNASLSVTGADDLGGIVSAVGGESSLAVAGDFVGTLNVGSNSVTGAILNVTQNNILPEANVHIFEGNTLNLGDPNTSVTAILGNGDTWDGDLNNHSNSEISIIDRKDFGTVGYSQDGTGVLNVTEGAAIRVKDASKITDGTINVASDATFASAANGFTVTDLNTAGTVNGINGGRENYNADTMTIGSAADPQTGVADTQADFQIDILGRSNRRNETDHFVATTIDPVAGNTEGTINISDWALNGDIYGWEAPIDRHISLDNVFQGTINENIDITATNKETFTPIGWYKLNANPDAPGSYTLDLARYNPWVFRGQVAKIAQYQNQLAIDDMLFTHSMVLPSFKENDHGYNASILSNRYAAGSPLYAPYEYSRKDGGVWFKMYGNFEHLNMNRGLNVENNSFGALIGADLGLKELRGGWTFMPTAYVGYNGAHQNYAHNGAWQNGGQAGFLGTWYKDNFIIGALVYGGVYNNEMDTPRGNDDAFNYFAGGSVKTAYNWRFHRDWVLQPNFLVAYNFFGEENWHSDFGQMGMMSGQLHGVNVAPGLNLIWEKDTFSAYATLQYMYNVNQSVGGRAGHVGLPHVHMDRGYIQYGIGFNKRFGDRFSGYLQAVMRNVGRTGVGFQGGFNFALGKNPSNYNAKLKGHTPTMQKAKLKMNSSHS